MCVDVMQKRVPELICHCTCCGKTSGRVAHEAGGCLLCRVPHILLSISRLTIMGAEKQNSRDEFLAFHCLGSKWKKKASCY